MSGLFRKKIALAVLAGLSTIALGSAAQAGSVDLVLKDAQTNTVTYDSGWTATWNDAFDSLIGVSADAAINNGTGVSIEKSVTFTPAFYNDQGGFINPAVITFTQRTGDDLTSAFNGYATTIAINDEQITNNTSGPWDSFRMFLMNGSATFDQTASAGFSSEPFQNSGFVSPTEIQFWNGIVNVGQIWQPGSTSGSLVINTNQGIAFTLKEQPIHAIPLPAAVWSGLSGLVGLGLLASRKKLKKLA